MKETPILFSDPMVRELSAGRKLRTRRVIKPQPKMSALPPRWLPKDRKLSAHMTDAWKSGFVDVRCPYVDLNPMVPLVSGRLWVREAWRTEFHGGTDRRIRFRADGAEVLVPRKHAKAFDVLLAKPAGDQCWRPSIFLPRWACRTVLEVTDVSVERLQEITEEEAIAEGVRATETGGHWSAWHPESETYPEFMAGPPTAAEDGIEVASIRHHKQRVLSTAVEQFRRLWQNINGERKGCDWFSDPWVWVISCRRVVDGAQG